MDLKEVIEGFNKMAEGARIAANATQDILNNLPENEEQKALIISQLNSMSDILKKAEQVVNDAVKG